MMDNRMNIKTIKEYAHELQAIAQPHVSMAQFVLDKHCTRKD
jgi:hypothetical protein